LSFDSPFMLIALAAAALPLLIHLYLRRRAPEVLMDAVMCLVLSGPGTRVRLRLVHAALLATRVAVVAMMALLFAMPYVKIESEAAVQATHPVAFAVVLDDSMSMRLTSDGKSLFLRAKSHVNDALAGLPAESEVFVVLASRPVRVYPTGTLTPDRPSTSFTPEEAARFVMTRECSRKGTDLAAALRAAVLALRSSQLRDRRVLVVSDFLDHGLNNLPSAVELAGLKVTAVDVGPRAGSRNRAVTRAVAEPATDVSARHVRVSFDVANWSDELLDEIATVRLGRAASARKVTCPPRLVCSYEVLLSVDEEVQAGEVRLPGDALADDDARYFTLSPRNREAVLVVNGQRRPVAELDEAFYLTKALGLRWEDHPACPVTVLRPEDLSPLHLSAVGVVVLANVASLQPDQVRAVNDFVAFGGGALVTVGEETRPDTSWDLGLLPAPLRATAASEPPQTCVWAAPDHPVTARISSGPGSLANIEVKQWAVLDGGWPDGTRVLARMGNGAPLLLERPLGKGTVLVLLTTIDADWTDFPLRPAFAPFVRQAVSYLVQAGVSGPKVSVEVGEPRPVELPEGAKEAVVIGPGGTRTRIGSSGDYVRTDVPGVYRVDIFAPGREEPIASDVFVANTSPAESDLSRHQGVPELFKDQGQVHERRPWRKVSLVPYVIVAILGLLAVEALLRSRA